MSLGLVGDYDSGSGDDDCEEEEDSWSECYDQTSGYPYYWNTKTNQVLWEKPKILMSSSSSSLKNKGPSPPKPPSSSSSSSLTSTKLRREEKKGDNDFVSSSSSSKKRNESRSKLSTISYNSNVDNNKFKKEGEMTSSSSSSQNDKISNGNGGGHNSSSKKSKVFIGPTIPEPTPEEIAISRIRKFENDLADGIIKEIYKESPFDWKENKPKSVLYESNFKWNKNTQILPTLEAKEKVKGSKNAIVLIGGVYGDNSEEEDNDHPSQEMLKKIRREKRKISVTVKNTNKKSKTNLGPVPSIFNQDQSSDEEISDNKESTNDSKKTNYSKSAGSQYKKTIDNVAETLCDKLEALNVDKIEISSLKLLAIQIQTLFDAWQSGALNSSYLQRTLSTMTEKMSEVENNEIAPPGWRVVWESSTKKYSYENLITGEIQMEKPPDDDDDYDEQEEVSQIHSEVSADKQPTPPPLPADKPLVPLPPLPPSPPKISIPAPPPPPDISNSSTNQVQDMEIEEDEDQIDQIPVQAPPPPPFITEKKNHLDSALDSFYSDLAALDKSNSNTPECTPPLSPNPHANRASSSTLRGSDEGSNSPLNDFDDTKTLKKRGKLTSMGLSMKKKGVGNLVAKWNNIQEQAKKSK